MFKSTVFAVALAASLAASASPAFAQRGGRGGGATNTSEATEFQEIADETIAARRIQLSEAFITAHRTSSFRPQVDQVLVDAYGRNQDWAKVVATAERLQREVRGGPAQTKTPIYASALMASVRMNDMAKAEQFGDWITAGDPNDINPYQLLATAIPDRLPQDPAQRTAALNKALEYAQKGIALQRPPRLPEADWDGAQQKLHLALAFVYLNLDQFGKAITEYETTLKINPKDAIAQYRLGMAYFLSMQEQIPAFSAALKAVDDAAAAKADAAKIKDLEAKREATTVGIVKARDGAIDAFIRAIAVGSANNSPAVQPSRQQLEPLFKNQSPDAPAGALDQLIAKKKAELGL